MTLVFLVLLEELCFTMQLGRVLLLVRDNFIVSSIVCVNFFNLSRGIGGVCQTMQVAGIGRDRRGSQRLSLLSVTIKTCG